VLLILFAFSILSETYLFMAGNLEARAKMSHGSQITQTIQQQITAKSAELALCPAGIVTKCKNPRTAELTALQSQLNTTMGANDTSYASVALQQFWGFVGGMVGASPAALELARYVLLSAVLEIVCLFFLGEFGSYKRIEDYDEPMQKPAQQERVVNPQPKVQAPAPPQVQQPPKPTVTTALPQYKTSFKDLKW
jgi:hypothetical protein